MVAGTKRDVGRGDEGQAAIELAGAVFVLLLVTVLAIQGILIAQGASVAQESARNGARALSQERSDWRRAAQESVPDGWGIVRIDGSRPGDRARVVTELEFPLGVAGIHVTDVRITRDAEFAQGS
ncbi:hypothetical protein GCM10023216_14470 [Isoptericola chiayiensis]|uniref:TadE-like domain-containing protein n=1 Tax=Isoptericola chiayiensis TaxID=579446 RepID=A0ABP8YCU2_9MICO|nr:hypothetical protein [Isoptericola chiayiensis]NOW02078.1 hypothetical protein [Isoptericola chiayiensis]